MIRNLAYVGFTTPDVDGWRSFSTDVLGASFADDPDGTLRLRIDERTWRVALHPGDGDDLSYLGWEIDLSAFADAVGRAEAFGLKVHEGDDATLAERAVERLVWFSDPFGFRHELVSGLAAGDDFAPGRPLRGEFVTGEQGLGHVVLVVPDAELADRFATEVLGMRLSDTIDPGGIELRFYHCQGSAARHHTLALAPFPGMRGVHHLMLEVSDLDDVGTALDAVKAKGIALTNDLGRHPNDLMTSFYVRTPSGFDIEYGTGGVVVDDATWTVEHYDEMSTWGHLVPEGAPPPGIIAPIEVSEEST